MRGGRKQCWDFFACLENVVPARCCGFLVCRIHTGGLGQRTAEPTAFLPPQSAWMEALESLWVPS